MNRKKIITVFMATCLLLSVAACGSKTSSDEEKSTTVEECIEVIIDETAGTKEDEISEDEIIESEVAVEPEETIEEDNHNYKDSIVSDRDTENNYHSSRQFEEDDIGKRPTVRKLDC